MTKKLKTLARADDKELAEAIRDSAQEIWQAGLGAFAVAEEEGEKLFTRLVKEGNDLQKRTRKLVEIRVSGVTDSVTKLADDVGKQASGSWDKLEKVFEDRVARTLASLGVPTSKEIHGLAMKIEDLSQTVANLSVKKAAAAKLKTATKRLTVVKAASKAAAKKATAKSAPKKRPVAARARPNGAGAHATR